MNDSEWSAFYKSCFSDASVHICFTLATGCAYVLCIHSVQMHMYMCIYMCMHVDIYIYVCMYIHIYAYIYGCACVCMCMYMCIYMYMYVYVCVHIYKYVSISHVCAVCFIWHWGMRMGGFN